MILENWVSLAGALQKQVFIVREGKLVSKTNSTSSDLVVFSHLRWTGVWQRPQQIISRMATRFDRVIFVEEPQHVPHANASVLRTEQCPSVLRAWLDLPAADGHRGGFSDERASEYAHLLQDNLHVREGSTVWLYTPLALPLAEQLSPKRMIFDVMDDLAAFAYADPALPALHIETLRRADVVFTGDRSLQIGARRHRPDAICFPSGVDLQHYGRSQSLRPTSRARMVAGYVGVVDERLNLPLLRQLAEELDDWDIHVVGPVAKLDPADLPVEPNLMYFGPRPYDALPEIMAGFDVALMPFALNAATRSISPTKSLEYLAAGLPVVSTPVPDVVTDFQGIVDLEDDGAAFAAACRRLADGHSAEKRRATEALLRWNQWDAIVERMLDHMETGAGDIDQEAV